MRIRRLSAIILGALLLAAPALRAQHNGAREAIEEKMRVTQEEIDQMLASRKSGQAPAEDRATLTEAASSEVVVSSDATPESELHAAVNPLDPTNLIVSVIRQGNNQTDPNGWLVCPVYYSKNLGKSWTKSTFKTLPPTGSTALLGGGDPILAFDANGTAYLTWINLYTKGSGQTYIFGLYWASSTDGGATWSVSSTPVIGEGKVTFSGGEVFDKEWMVIDTTSSQYRNSIYVVFMHSSNSGSTAIGVRKKTATSPGFTTADATVASNFSEVQFGSIDVGLTGDVHVTFYGNGDDGIALYHSVSTDGGTTFSEPNIISTFHLPRLSPDESMTTVTGIDANRIYPSPHLVIDHSSGPTRGYLYQVWSANGIDADLGDGLDVYFSRSTDNGQSWSNPIIVNDDPRGLERHQFYPSLTVNPKGMITVGWYDRRNDPNERQTDYYLAHSLNGGLSFQPSFKITSKSTDFSTVGDRNNGFGIGEYTQIVSTADYVIPFWADGRKNTGDLDVYTAVIVPGTSEVKNVSRVADATENLRIHDPVVMADRIDLGVELAARSRLAVSLVDMAGKVVAKTSSVEYEEGSHTIELGVSGLPAGAYILSCDSDFGRQSRSVNLAH